MGAIPELFRTRPAVHRSNHPVMSLAAWGQGAAALVAHHPVAWALGNDSPMGRFHDRDGSILLLGVGHNRKSSLHLAETRARHRRTRTRITPVQGPDGFAWESQPDVANGEGRLFPAIGADFEATGAVTIGSVGDADARLMRHQAMVGFATAWLDRELPTSSDNH